MEASTDAEITNNNAEHRQSCICLGPAGNRQRSSKCFVIETGTVVVWHVFDVLPHPDAILKKVGNWGNHSKCAILRGRINLLKRKWERIDWDNDDLTDLQAVDERPKLVHQDIISELPGVKTADMYAGIIWRTPFGEEKTPPLYAERATKVRINADLDTDNQAQGVTRKQGEVITIEDDGNGVVPGVLVKEDPIDAFSLSREDNFPGQEMVNSGKNDEISDKGESLGQN